MIRFLGSKLVFNKGIKNYFLLKGRFSFPNGIKKPSVSGRLSFFVILPAY